MDELVAYVRAQLDERERVAQAVSSGPGWQAVVIPDVSGPSTTLELGGPDDRVVLAGFADDDPIRPSEAQHIALNDPAAVLADVAAKRAILDQYEGAQLVAEDDPHDETAQADESTLLTVVHLLAQPYAGREGWREEWTITHPTP